MSGPPCLLGSRVQVIPYLSGNRGMGEPEPSGFQVQRVEQSRQGALSLPERAVETQTPRSRGRAGVGPQQEVALVLTVPMLELSTLSCGPWSSGWGGSPTSTWSRARLSQPRPPVL